MLTPPCPLCFLSPSHLCSFLENPSAPSRDSDRVQTVFYDRTREQTIELGYAVEENKSEIESMAVVRGAEAKKKLTELFPEGLPAAQDGKPNPTQRGVTVAPAAMAAIDTYFNVSDRSALMTGPCGACDNPEAETRMCVTDVPHFKDVVLLVTQCEQCGYRDAEVKPMGVVSEKGRRITLRVTSTDDMKRDLLKSDTASVTIPELDLELLPGTLGGKYTTLEGMVEDIRDQLTRFNPFAMGDSTQPEQKAKMDLFVERLGGLSDVTEPWTFVLDCPLGNVFIFSPLGESDPNMTVERYERTFEQNEELGLNDINVDNYLSEEQQAEMDAEIAADEAAKKVEQDMSAAMGDAAITEAETDKARMVELKKSKIGGLINVDHDVDQEGFTGNKATSSADASAQ